MNMPPMPKLATAGMGSTPPRYPAWERRHGDLRADVILNGRVHPQRHGLFRDLWLGVLVAIFMMASIQAGPVILRVTNAPSQPGDLEPVWVTAHVTGAASVSLRYSTALGSSQSNLVFLESMAQDTIKQWTGAGCDNPWAVAFAGTKNPFAQNANANYGAGNTNGLAFKGVASTTNCSENTITTVRPIDTRGASGFVEFWLRSLTLTANAGWTFQLNSGTGFVTRLSETSGLSHNWQLYHYDLQPGELTSNLTMRFQFQSDPASVDNRVYLDQISVMVTHESNQWSTVAMLDDGFHSDGVSGDGVYGGQIPGLPAGSQVRYYLSAADTGGVSVNNPLDAPTTVYDYLVRASVLPRPLYNVLLGRPSDRTVAMSILSTTNLEVFIGYGTKAGVYDYRTSTNSAVADVPTVITLEPLSPSQSYFYRVYSRPAGTGDFSGGTEGSFHTCRNAGEAFTFIIEADPHYLDNEPAVWQLALTNMLADHPDFLIDLGDLFMGEKYSKTNSSTLSESGIYEACRAVRDQFFSITGHSVPLFLVDGNHDPELGWLLSNAAPTNNSAVWGAQAR